MPIMYRLTNWLSMVSIFWLTSCMVLPTGFYAPIGDTAQLRLATEWPGEPQQTLHQLTWSHPDHGSQTFLVSSVLLHKALIMVGLSPLGHELWRVELSSTDGLQATGIKPFDDVRMATTMVSDLQLHLWPTHSLVQQLRNANVHTNGPLRQIRTRSGVVLWQARTDGHITEIENVAAGYKLQLQLLDKQILTTNKQGQ